MKRLIFSIFSIFSLCLAGCTALDDVAPQNDGSLRGVTFEMGMHASSAASPFDAEQIRELNGYLFDKDGILTKIYTGLVTDANGHTELQIPYFLGEQLYFIANAAGLLPEDEIQAGKTSETEFRNLVLESETPLADGNYPLMTAAYTMTKNGDLQPTVRLSRAQARVDLEVVVDEGVQVDSIAIGNLCKTAYLFPQDRIQSPPNSPTGLFEQGNDPALTPGLYEGICYLYEQASGSFPLYVFATINGVSSKLVASLPNEIRRNTIYKITVSGVGATLQTTVSVGDWEIGDTTTSEPEVNKIEVDTVLSVMADGASVSLTGDTVFLPCWESESTLVLKNVPDDVEITVDGASPISFIPLAQTRADLQGRRFLLRTSSRRPSSLTELTHLKVHSKDRPGYYEGRLVVVLKAAPIVFRGDIMNVLSDVEPYGCHFNKYIDGVLGTIKIPEGAELSVSDNNWLRVIPKDNGVYEVQAGYKPNDIHADGRLQECVLTVAHNGREEEFAISRLNYGLPVVLMDGTYWCRFNLSGNSRDFEDQIQIPEAASIENDADYFATCTDEEFIRVMGSGYKGRNANGMELIYSTVFKYDKYNSTNTNGGGIGNGPATAHCPDGYQIPSNADFYRLLKTGGFQYNGNSISYTTGGGKPATATKKDRTSIACGAGRLSTITYHQIDIGGSTLVLGGLGHQYNTDRFSVNNVLFAVITGNAYTWGCGATGFNRAEHNDSKTRSVRCIKTTPAFIIEE